MGTRVHELEKHRTKKVTAALEQTTEEPTTEEPTTEEPTTEEQKPTKLSPELQSTVNKLMDKHAGIWEKIAKL